MTRILLLLLGSLATVTFATVILIAIPKAISRRQAQTTPVPEYTADEAIGRQVYIANGCIYCHSQQIRDPLISSDVQRGWGRPSYPSDYAHDQPALLGTQRTGPDLVNVGIRLPDEQWHLIHLYQPRALSPWSIMPAFPFLFRHKEERRVSFFDPVVNVPESHRPKGYAVIASPEALALVSYLKSLKRMHEPPEIRRDDAEEGGDDGS